MSKEQNVWETMFHKAPTPAEEATARSIAGKLDKKYSITFQRAGSQRFCEADSEKEVIGDAIDGNAVEGHDYTIATDGVIEWGASIVNTTGDFQRHFTVRNYGFLIKTIILRDKKGYITNKIQTVTCKDAKIKYMCQSLLNHLVG